MRVDVAPQHGLLDLQDLSLDDNVLDATHEWDSIGVESFKPESEGVNYNPKTNQLMFLGSQLACPVLGALQ